MQVYKQQIFECLYDQDSAGAFSDIEFHDCEFQSCVLSITRDPALRTHVKNVRLLNCKQLGSMINTAILEDVVLDGLSSPGQLFQIFGAVFNRVTIRGKIDRLMINNDIFPNTLLDKVYRDEETAQWRKINADYYRTIEWALDIRDAEFKEFCIRGVPGQLIRRDPETQFLVTREKAMTEGWQSLPFKENLFPGSISLFLQANETSTVFIAPKRHPKFRNYLHDLKLLRDAGVAE